MQYSDAWVKIPSKTLEEVTVGIVGVGNVGKALAKKLMRLKCGSILGYDVVRITPPESVEMTDLDNLLLRSDYVCICCCQTEENPGFIGEEFISKMKPKSYLINMARGRLMDEEAIIKALQSHHLSGLALDVFVNEPLPKDSMLRRMPNVILGSHNANSSPKYWEKVHLNTVRNALNCLHDM